MVAYNMSAYTKHGSAMFCANGGLNPLQRFLITLKNSPSCSADKKSALAKNQSSFYRFHSVSTYSFSSAATMFSSIQLPCFPNNLQRKQQQQTAYSCIAHQKQPPPPKGLLCLQKSSLRRIQLFPNSAPGHVVTCAEFSFLIPIFFLKL